jgi:hypothetical protein
LANYDPNQPTLQDIINNPSRPANSGNFLSSMARTQAAGGDGLVSTIVENIMRDPTSILGAGLGEAVGAGAAKLGGGVLGRLLSGGADVASQTGLQAANQYGTGGGVDPASMGLAAALMGAGHGVGAGVAQVAPKARAAILDNPNFQKWLGGSRAVDAAGNPLVMYHGTSSDFESFDPKMTGRTYGSDKKGVFLAENPDQAHNAAIDSRFSVGGAENIMPVHVRMENPYSPGLTTQQFDEADKAKIFKAAKKAGADGIRLDDGTWIALSPTQIKSATGNRGTFDPNDPNITQ